MKNAKMNFPISVKDGEYGITIKTLKTLIAVDKKASMSNLIKDFMIELERMHLEDHILIMEDIDHMSSLYIAAFYNPYDKKKYEKEWIIFFRLVDKVFNHIWKTKDKS